MKSRSLFDSSLGRRLNIHCRCSSILYYRNLSIASFVRAYMWALSHLFNRIHKYTTCIFLFERLFLFHSYWMRNVKLITKIVYTLSNCRKYFNSSHSFNTTTNICCIQNLSKVMTQFNIPLKQA